MELFSKQAIIKWTKSFPYNMGMSPVLVLGELKQNRSQKQTVLTEKLGFTPGAMTNIANRLIKEGYAERQINEEDRRVIFLDITDEGKQVLEQAHEKGKQLHLELFQALRETEIQQLLAIYKKLLQQSQSD